MRESQKKLIQQTSKEIRNLAEAIDKTAGEKLDSDKVLDFLRFFKGRNYEQGK